MKLQHQKNGRCDHPLKFKKDNSKQYTNYRKSLLSLFGKVNVKCLERECHGIVESKIGGWIMRFLSSSQHHGPYFHSKANLREILRIWQTSLHALSTLKKHMIEFLMINFGGFYKSMVSMVSCCLPLSLSTAALQVCVHVNDKQSIQFKYYLSNFAK